MRSDGNLSGQGDQAKTAYEFVRDGIFSGQFLPGDRLTESKIAADAGVSRTPVREALRWLERDGVVVIEKNKGARVRELNRQRISDHYEFRARMEGFAASLAADRVTKEDQFELLRAVERFEQATQADATGLAHRVHESNLILHRTIAHASGNAFLATALSATMENPLVAATSRPLGDLELQRSVVFHQLIVEAIINGHSSRAERLMIEHVLQIRDVLLNQ